MATNTTNSRSLLLNERVSRKNNLKNVLGIIILFLLLSLLFYRLLSLTSNYDFHLLLAFLCELYFTFTWFTIIITKWNPIDYKTYPDRISPWVGELPPVDMFVTTANAELEPPMMTVNTVLSLLAVDYPANKLACYVSDDGCSPLILYSLMEASNFAKLWVPFCKKHNVQLRAPFRYFSNNNNIKFDSGGFQQEWKIMKDEYEKLCCKIEEAVQKSAVPCDLGSEFEVFSNVEPRNHPTIIKVIWENKEDVEEGWLPHLVYISREKRPNHPHHYKAGAMNILARVSGVMTNAPFMLNVDCDMFVNNPKVILQAMCLLLGSKSHKEVAFAQFPQVFYDLLKDDPYGNQMVVLFEYMARGAAGLQGAFYAGTGCFHRRQVLYGLSPDDIEIGQADSTNLNEKLSDSELVKSFGKSKDFKKAAANALKGMNLSCRESVLKFDEAAFEVAGCGYEYGTSWGSKVGWIYGATTEDIHTGLVIHKKGWRSVQCTPEPPAFLGCAATSGPSSMTQQKRWATGLLEILFSKNFPIFLTLFEKLQFRQCLAYLWLFSWGLRSIFELCYAALPAYCIITNSHFLPKVEERAFYVPASFFAIYNIYTLSEYFSTGQSIRAWWNNQRMERIKTMGPWLLGLLSVILKLLGISETVFEVTKKDQSSSSDGGKDNDQADAGRFTFDESPVFVVLTTILLVQLIALALGLLGLSSPAHQDGEGFGFLEICCSVWLVLCFWPLLKGLFGKGIYGIPISTVCKAIGLAFLFVHLCKRSTSTING
ncbi:hypothetical protein UlMin_022980 [Ulmus minor]